MNRKAKKPRLRNKPPPSIPREVLAQWRGIDLTDEEIALARSEKSARDVMPQVLKDLGLDRKRLEAEVAKVWFHSIDPNVVEHAQPVGLRHGTLFVNVDSNVWLSEIVRYRREEILERLQCSFGSEFIKKISFRVG